MPSITQYREQTQSPTGVPTRGGTVDPGAIGVMRAGLRSQEEFARGTTQILGAVLQNEEEQARAWASTTLSKARLQWTEELINRQSDPEQIKDGANGFTPRMLQDFDDYAKKAVESAPNGPSQRFLTTRMEDLRADLGSKALVYEAKARIDWRKDQFIQAGNNVEKLVAADPSQYQEALAEQLAIVDASAMPQIEKSAVRQWMFDKVSSAAVWGQMKRDPNAFLASIGFYGERGAPAAGVKVRTTSGDLKEATGNSAFDALPFDSRVKMFEQAIRMKAQQDADSEKATKLAQDKAANDAMKNAWDMLYDPKGSKLTLEYVQSVKPLLKENDYKSLLQALRTGPEQKTDPVAYAQLERAVYGGDYEGATKLAYSLQQNGRISNDTLGSALLRIKQFQKENGPNTPYERGRAYINRVLNPGEIDYDPVRNRRLGEALREYDNWALANPKAGDTDIQKRTTEIVNSHQLLNFGDSTLTLPVPLGTTIRRSNNPALLEADIAKAAAKIKDDRSSNKITQKDYDERMATLKKWIDALNQVKGHK